MTLTGGSMIISTKGGGTATIFARDLHSHPIMVTAGHVLGEFRSDVYTAIAPGQPGVQIGEVDQNLWVPNGGTDIGIVSVKLPQSQFTPWIVSAWDRDFQSTMKLTGTDQRPLPGQEVLVFSGKSGVHRMRVLRYSEKFTSPSGIIWHDVVVMVDLHPGALPPLTNGDSGAPVVQHDKLVGIFVGSEIVADDFIFIPTNGLFETLGILP